ncbi:dTDP-glucose 4,6-dehydratase [Alkalihalobacillus sp. CinArs1]|uniref:dTDP-glucose 4,6-dehydratase n=1 Tax=Alkalihalobacillus sp. CinArs1 TaxID=2995314 RepID=UPI0022DDF84B|nr:dTDP-glucose 4,6-dehydratase [Alkalihalobacillus sp. CinArs1]
MRVLVTGGAGFIGSNFIHYLFEKHPTYSIINVDALTYAGNLENLKQIEHDDRYTFVHADISDREAMAQVFKTHSIDAVVNFAAESHVDRSIEHPESFVYANIIGTHVLLDLTKTYGVKFVQISTDEVYGSLGAEGYFHEEMALSPSSPYSASKASADLLALSYFKTYGLYVCITRCSNNYGPYQFPEKLIPLMISNALEGKALPIYGDGQNVRDWLHVNDHCSAIDLVLHGGKAGEVYNVGGNTERKNIELVEALVKKVGCSPDLITFIKDRPGHDRRYAIDATKISTELGWKPRFSFEEGIEETVRWYKKNRGWWERVKTGEYVSYYEKQYQP